MLAALLISGIDSHAMLRSSPQAEPADFSQALVARRAPVRLPLQRHPAEPQPGAVRSVAFSIAPPAVTLVDQARFVSLRDDVADILFGRGWPGAGGQFASSSISNLESGDTASNDEPSTFAIDPDFLTERSFLLPACLIVLLSTALGFAGSWVFGRQMRALATRFDAIADAVAGAVANAVADAAAHAVTDPAVDPVAHAAAINRCPSGGIPEQGPRALRRLARGINGMLAQRCHAMAEQSATLRALGEHLESHALRLRRATLLVREWQQRVALVEDVDLFAHIARQFIEVNRRAPAQDGELPVEAFIRDRFVMTSSLDAGLFVCTFDAGVDFRLPRTLLERVMSNLVDNALEYGSPPIEIGTARENGEWILAVRDHGAGIKPSRLSDATSTFVRLGRDGNDQTERADLRHWGLGLALVKRLVANAGGRLVLANHPGGGLLVRIAFPVSRSVQPSPRAAHARDVCCDVSCVDSRVDPTRTA